MSLSISPSNHKNKPSGSSGELVTDQYLVVLLTLRISGLEMEWSYTGETGSTLSIQNVEELQILVYTAVNVLGMFLIKKKWK